MAVQGPVGSRLGGSVPLAVHQQRKQTRTRMSGVFDNLYGLLPTPPGIEVLDGRELSPSDVLGHTQYALQSDAKQLPYQTVMQPVKMLSMVYL